MPNPVGGGEAQYMDGLYAEGNARHAPIHLHRWGVVTDECSLRLYVFLLTFWPRFAGYMASFVAALANVT